MTEPSGTEYFYVSVAAEVDEPDLVADIVFAGRQVAAVRRVAGVWTVTLYDPSGSEGSISAQARRLIQAQCQRGLIKHDTSGPTSKPQGSGDTTRFRTQPMPVRRMITLLRPEPPVAGLLL